MISSSAALHAADNEDFDQYKLRIDAEWVYAYPSGSFQDATTGDTIDLKKDFGFGPYSTFTGKLDWKFTRKNHLYLVGGAYDKSQTATLTRTITFQGQTFNVGVVTKASMSVPFIAPGYQYDIIRRKRGHLGIAVQVDLFDADASLSAAAQVTGDGTHYGAISASKSLLAPIPVAGPEFRFYLTNSPRLYVEGNVYGMYLFGYGNFVSTADALGLTLSRHFAINAGYQLGSRLTVTDDSKTNRLGLRLTQQGPMVGAELSF